MLRHSRLADQFLGTRQIRNAWHFHQNIRYGDGIAMFLNVGFREAQAVDAAIDGGDRTRHGIALQIVERRRLHVEFVVVGTDRRQSPLRRFVRNHGAECLRFCRIHAVDIDLNGVGFLRRLRIVAFEARDRDIACAGFIAQTLDQSVGFALGGVLYLNVEDQVTAPAEIEPEVNALAGIGLGLFEGGGEADHTEDTGEDGGRDHSRFNHQIALHAYSFLFLRGATVWPSLCLPEARAYPPRRARTAASDCPA